MNRNLTPLLALVLLAWTRSAIAQDANSEDLTFFENRVRPVLVEHCHKCHAATIKNPKGGLRVDSRVALLQGGDNGPAIVPGEPGKSRLIEALHYKNPDLQMPPKAKLSGAVIADLERWIARGAAWPSERTPGMATKENAFDLAQRQRDHWAWKPVRPQVPPRVKETAWPRGPVDQFVLARLEASNLRPAPNADKRTLLRRLSFDLVGLPPTESDLNAFLQDDTPEALTRVVDRLLASRHFGERWARHWLDLVRYGETRGHEFDPVIPNAHHYRDYIIRALNNDIAYDQLVREHIAGDILPTPRRDPSGAINESLLGTGFWFLGEEVHSPVDIRQDQADRFDNRIDVMTKAFLGLTVACARCHDHKFDAISTRDYYALFGFLASSHYRQVSFETREQNRQMAADLARLRGEHQSLLRRRLAALLRSASAEGERRVAEQLARPATRETPPQKREIVVDWRRSPWLPDGEAFGAGPVRAGEVRLEGGLGVRLTERDAAVYDRVWDVLRAAPEAQKDPGALGGMPFRPGRTLYTPSFPLTTGRLFYLVKGAGAVYAAVGGHTLIQGPLHGKLVLNLPTSADYRWVAHDLSRYQGLVVHLEFTPAVGSDFALAQVMQGETPPTLVEPVGRFTTQGSPRTLWEDLVTRLEKGTLADSPDASVLARVVNELLSQPGPLEKEVRELNEQAVTLRAQEKPILARIRAESQLGLALFDGTGVDEQVFIRGSPKALGEHVPRRFLEALVGPKALAVPRGSGRLELARQITDPQTNPFLARVAVNRVWHHLFGRGLVGSVDNFGVLGEAPTHPELLDYLATQFVSQGWSIKSLIRELVLTRTYALSAKGSPDMDQKDPNNLLLHRARLRRLEGELIRDAILTVSGRLDDRMYGPSVPIYLTPFLDGRGRPGSGPLDGAGRRSLYLAVKRNFLSPFLLAFDTPTPFSTVGRRTMSNVPAQALILLNDPFVHQQAGVWARRVLTSPGTATERIQRMYVAAFGRPPTDEELTACLGFLEEQAKRRGAKVDDEAVWSDLAHTLFNVKEFVYVG